MGPLINPKEIMEMHPTSAMSVPGHSLRSFTASPTIFVRCCPRGDKMVRRDKRNGAAWTLGIRFHR
jgi:hypothetical protein